MNEFRKNSDKSISSFSRKCSFWIHADQNDIYIKIDTNFELTNDEKSSFFMIFSSAVSFNVKSFTLSHKHHNFECKTAWKSALLIIWIKHIDPDCVNSNSNRSKIIKMIKLDFKIKLDFYFRPLIQSATTPTSQNQLNHRSKDHNM